MRLGGVAALAQECRDSTSVTVRACLPIFPAEGAYAGDDVAEVVHVHDLACEAPARKAELGDGESLDVTEVIRRGLTNSVRRPSQMRA